jgi:hypothetical protein
MPIALNILRLALREQIDLRISWSMKKAAAASAQGVAMG